MLGLALLQMRHDWLELRGRARRQRPQLPQRAEQRALARLRHTQNEAAMLPRAASPLF